MSVTLTNLRTQVYDLLREEQNSNAYPYTLVDQMINIAQQEICTGQVVNPINKQSIKKGRLPFLESDEFYTNIQNTTLASSCTIWDTTLTVADTSNFPSTWTLFLNWEIITYSSKTSTTFTCSAVKFAHQSWINVSILFTLPTDYASSIQVVYNYSHKLEQKSYDSIFESMNDLKDNNYIRDINTNLNLIYTNPFYSIINWTYLAIFNLNKTWDSIHLRYEKLPNELTNTNDTAIIDNDIYAKTTITYLTAWEMLFNRWEEDRWWQLINFWLWKLESMYTYYNNRTYENISWVAYKTAKQRNYNF